MSKNLRSVVSSMPKPLFRVALKLRQFWRFGYLRFGSFSELSAINNGWGFERGMPIDRYYIEAFLEASKDKIQGSVLSIGDDYYSRKFGDKNVTNNDVLHINSTEEATIVGDLSDCPHVASDTFDCFLLIETLQLIYDFKSAIANSHRILKPGGTVLATFPGISPLKDEDWTDTWFWNFTSQSAYKIFTEVFSPENVSVTCYGNALTTTSFLHGLSIEDLGRLESKLNFHDPQFELVICVVAVK